MGTDNGLSIAMFPGLFLHFIFCLLSFFYSRISVSRTLVKYLGPFFLCLNIDPGLFDVSALGDVLMEPA